MHVHGQREIVTALIDTLLLRATKAFVEPDGTGRWIPLERVPIAAAGFAEQEALIEEEREESAPFRLLAEYFDNADLQGTPKLSRVETSDAMYSFAGWWSSLTFAARTAPTAACAAKTARWAATARAWIN